MSDLLLAWCFCAVIVASVAATCLVIRELHMSRYPGRVGLYFVIVAVNALCALLAFKVVEGLLRWVVEGLLR